MCKEKLYNRATMQIVAVDRSISSRRSPDMPGRGYRRFPKVSRSAASGQECGRHNHEEETDASFLRSSYGSYYAIK